MPGGTPSTPPSDSVRRRRVSRGIFRKDGEYWTLGREGRVFRLKDTKGFAYLAHLLRHPATEFHALDLVGGIAHHREDDESSRPDAELETAGIHVATSDDAGEMLDDRAKATYRRRLDELREELDAAKALGQVGRAEVAEREIAILTSELSRAVGLHGRDRRAVSASERARQSVTKTIRAVIERIAQNDAALGDVLSRCIRTGTFCAYEHDPDVPIAWEFGPTDPESGSAPMPLRDAGTTARDARPAVLGVSLFSLAERTRFVGREPELTTIRGAIARALEGQGSLVMLAGGPGVGKTRLAMEMADDAARGGFRVLVGHCYERDEPFPYLPFAEIVESGLAQAASLDDFRKSIGDNAAELAHIVPRLRRVFTDLPEPRELPSQQRRRHLFQSFSETLARSARVRPQLHVVDDLHWADESTLSLLVHLSHRVAQFPVVIIATFRAGYGEENPALVRTLEELIRMGVRPLKLGGLSRDEVAQVLQTLDPRSPSDRLVNLLYDETEGNPFFGRRCTSTSSRTGGSSTQPANSVRTSPSTRSTSRRTSAWSSVADSSAWRSASGTFWWPPR